MDDTRQTTCLNLRIPKQWICQGCGSFLGNLQVGGQERARSGRDSCQQPWEWGNHKMQRKREIASMIKYWILHTDWQSITSSRSALTNIVQTRRRSKLATQRQIMFPIKQHFACARLQPGSTAHCWSSPSQRVDKDLPSRTIDKSKLSHPMSVKNALLYAVAKAIDEENSGCTEVTFGQDIQQAIADQLSLHLQQHTKKAQLLHAKN